MLERQNQFKNDSTFLLPNNFKSYLDAFIKKLIESGYSKITINNYRTTASHFMFWLSKETIPIRKINDGIITNFTKHKCCCSNSTKPRRTPKVFYKAWLGIC